jgi:hypothetical protein
MASGKQGKGGGKNNAARERAQKAREQAQKSHSDRQSGGQGTKFAKGGIDFFTPKCGEGKAGRNTFAIIPYRVSDAKHPDGIKPGEIWHRRPYKTHRNIGAEGNAYVCLSSFGEKCPLCIARAELMGNYEANKELIKALRPSDRELYNVQVEGEDGIKIFDISVACFGGPLHEEDQECEADDPFYGALEYRSNVRARFKEKSIGGGRPFPECSKIEFVESEDLPESILDDVYDLDNILKKFSYDALERIYLELDGEDEAPEKEERGKGGGKSSGKKAKEEPEEDEKPECFAVFADAKKCKKCTHRADCEDQTPEPEEEKPSCFGEYDKKDKACKACDFSTECKDHEVPAEEDPEPEEEEKPTCYGEYDKKDKSCKACDFADDCKAYEKPEEPADEKPEVADDECPNDFTFGKDCDKDPKCEDCDNWPACKEAQDKAKDKKGAAGKSGKAGKR